MTLMVLVINLSVLSTFLKGEEILSKMTSHDRIQYLVLGYHTGNMIPFSTVCPKTGEVYRWMPLAIVVLKIECDGKEVSPFARGLAMNRFDPGVVEVKSAHVAYLSNLNPLVSIQKYDAATGEYEASGYNIPPEFKTLVITYAYRLPDGEISQKQELKVTIED
jgi:hypothetical protein